MRNETSYEETLHVVAFNCAYYDLFYELLLYVFSDLGWDSVRHSGNGMGWSRAFGLDELAFSCFQILSFGFRLLGWKFKSRLRDLMRRVVLVGVILC